MKPEGYSHLTWMRSLNRTVTQLSPGFYRIDTDLSPIAPLPGAPSYMTHTTLSGCETAVWPEGAPGAGKLLVSFLAQRGSSSHTAGIVPIGSTGLSGCDATRNVAGTEWTYIDSGDVRTSAGYPITLAWRDSTAADPISIAWGLQSLPLAGTTRARSHSAAMEGFSGAPTVTAKSLNLATSGTTYTSPNIVATGAGRIVWGWSYTASSPADCPSCGNNATYTAVSPAVMMTSGYAYGNFSPRSAFGYLDVTTAGTYNVQIQRSGNIAGSTNKYGWLLAFWPS